MDGFGNLPDELLCHILSFLTTKESALTSVLSKRWFNLWTSVYNLDIDDSVFLYPQEGKRERKGILESFMDFTDKALAFQGDSPIERCSLKCKTGTDSDRVNVWICNVLKRGVSHLELGLDFPDEFDSEDMYKLPQGLFESKTLVNLNLSSDYCVDWWYEGTIYFPMLKTLYIDTGLIIFRKGLKMFRSAFPVLEELCLNSMKWFFWDETLSSASLKKLAIYARGSVDLLNPKKISFDIPSLVNEDQLKFIRAPYDEDDGFLYLRNVWKLMSGLRNVRSLFLSTDTIEVLSLCSETMLVFNKLEILRIKSDKKRGWQAMPVLLRNCPHLETLILENLFHYVTDKCGDACDCVSREDKGRSLSSCPVKIMEIIGFQGTIRELLMIWHFLKYFPCLEKMSIIVEKYEPTEFVCDMLTSFDEFFSCDVQLYRRKSTCS